MAVETVATFCSATLVRVADRLNVAPRDLPALEVLVPHDDHLGDRVAVDGVGAARA